MAKICLLAVLALAMTGCAGMPWVVTASSDGGASSDRAAHSKRAVPPRDSVMLGEQEVDYRVDRDTINVGNHEGSFRALYFIVEKNDIELFNLVIDYGNGDTQALNTRLVFNEGSRSRLIDLNGQKRRIKSIRFTYKTVGTWQEGKARVTVYGVK